MPLSRRPSPAPPSALAAVPALVDGPLDLVGDVHGEAEALETLLDRLGYRTDGSHPTGRHLVFVGDLFDRGPDSPAVFRRVQSLVAAGRAQVVLGNHELTLLRGVREQGNHWFFGLAEDPAHPAYGRCAAIAPTGQDEILDFLRHLPVALQRPDLRVAHAAWDDAALALCRSSVVPWERQYAEADEVLHEDPDLTALRERARPLQARYAAAIRDPRTRWPDAEVIDRLGRFEAAWHNGNALRVVTAGPKEPVAVPYYAGGKWRFTARVPWWERYTAVPVVYGHYWRWWQPCAQPVYSRGEPPLFAEPTPTRWPARESSCCIDFSVGGRFRERHLGAGRPFQGRLAAVRWPEREFVFDGPAPAPMLQRAG